MKKEEFFDEFGPTLNDHVDIFIKELYNSGYVIISPEERKKIDGMTVLATAHGMNPFELDKK